MNKAYKLLDKNYVTELLRQQVVQLYPNFTDIKKVNIKSHKKMIWEKTYHLVLEYDTVFVDKTGKERKLPIFCSAHSDEPRKNVYTSLKYLWNNGFDKGYLSVPHPLFYSSYFKATFYRGVAGRNLYYYIRNKDLNEVENILPKAARWFVKLHRLPTEEAPNFNKENSRIKTVFPGVDHIIQKIENNYPQYLDVYKQAYDFFVSQEEAFLSSINKLYLVHGDAHPENIIRMSPRKIAVIDFTDLCLSDFARDLGTFLQQLEFMLGRKIGNKNFSDKAKRLFLDTYFSVAGMDLNSDIQKRIDNYYYWTAMRTATFFLIKDKAEPERAKPLIDNVMKEFLLNK